MTVKSFTFGPFQTNTYVVSDLPRANGQEPIVLLVDPACYTEYERQTLANYIDKLTAEGGLSIVATHGHLDHLWGTKWATERWQTPVLMHEADIPMARAMQESILPSPLKPRFTHSTSRSRWMMLVATIPGRQAHPPCKMLVP